jgi:acetate kinase
MATSKPTVILSVNAGSSSVKATLFKAEKNDQPERIAAAQVTGISSPPAQFTYTRDNNKHKQELSDTIKSHNDAFQYILKTLLDDKDLGIVSSKDDIDYACHRVVHGVSTGRLICPSD